MKGSLRDIFQQMAKTLHDILPGVDKIILRPGHIQHGDKPRPAAALIQQDEQCPPYVPGQPKNENGPKQGAEFGRNPADKMIQENSRIGGGPKGQNPCRIQDEEGGSGFHIPKSDEGAIIHERI